MPTLTHFIDPPSPFAPADEWRAYLAELIEANAETPNAELQAAIKDAEDHIASLR